MRRLNLPALCVVALCLTLCGCSTYYSERRTKTEEVTSTRIVDPGDSAPTKAAEADEEKITVRTKTTSRVKSVEFVDPGDQTGEGTEEAGEETEAGAAEVTITETGKGRVVKQETIP